MTKTLFFVQDFCKSMVGCDDFLFDKQIIALTPMAMYELDKRNIHYNIPEDYFNWKENSFYQDWFNKWINELEKFVIETYPELFHRIPVTTYFLPSLKSIVDVFVRKYLQFQNIISVEKPSSVYMVREDQRSYIDDELYFNEGLFYLFLAHNFYPDPKFIRATTCYGTKSVTNWRDNKLLRSVYDWLRCFQFIPSYKRELPMLFISPVPDKIRVLKLHGYKVKILKEIKSDKFEYGEFDIGVPNIIFELFEEINISRYDAKSILYPRLNYFISNVLDRGIFYYFGLRNYIIKNGFSYIFVTRRNTICKIITHIVANELGCKTVYVKHGWQGYEMSKFDSKRWLEPYDVFISFTEDDQRRFKRFSDNEGYECKVI